MKRALDNFKTPQKAYDWASNRASKCVMHWAGYLSPYGPPVPGYPVGFSGKFFTTCMDGLVKPISLDPKGLRR